MKVSSLSRSVSTRSVTHLPLSTLDKENTPQNQAPIKRNADRNELKGKIGLSIKRKISEMGTKKDEGDRSPLLDTTSRLTNSLHSVNEPLRTSSASLSKRVCFQAGEIHSAIRKPGLKKKKSILKKSSSSDLNCSALEVRLCSVRVLRSVWPVHSAKRSNSPPNISTATKISKQSSNKKHRQSERRSNATLTRFTLQSALPFTSPTPS